MNFHLLKESLGWVATAAFAASYLCRSQRALRTVQALAAVLWVSYGLAMGSLPVVASNAAVAFMAVGYPLLRRAVAQRAETVTEVGQEPATRSPHYEELPQLI